MAIAVGNTRNSIGAINVTPLIDILLVLLIIFMVITPSQPVGLGAAIPQPSPDSAASAPDTSIVIQIDRNAEIRINSEITDTASLGDRLSAIFKRRAERVVFVKADPDLEFRHVARVIDIAKGANISTIGLLGNRI